MYSLCRGALGGVKRGTGWGIGCSIGWGIGRGQAHYGRALGGAKRGTGWGIGQGQELYGITHCG